MRYLAFFLILISSLAEARRKTEWALHIDTKVETAFYPQKNGDSTNQEFYRAELNPNYTWKYEDQWRFYVRPQFIADPGNNSESERYFFDLSEAYVRYKADAVTVQAGNSLYNWGVTDGFNPLDVINGRQYFDPLDSRKLGATSLSLSQSFENWDYELVYIPLNRGAILPGNNSRWLPRKILVPELSPDDQKTVFILPDELLYSFSDRRTLDDALHNNYALRVQWRGFVDVGLSHYDGVASFPLVRPEVSGQLVESFPPENVIVANPNVLLHTQDYRIKKTGLSLVANYWNMLFKYAGSYSQSVGEDSYYPGLPNTYSLLPGWLQENVVGLERTFYFGDLMLIAVLQHSFINKEKSTDSNLSVTEIFRDAWMLGGRLSWGEVWSGSLMGLYSAPYNSHFERVSLSRRFLDAWTVTATASFIEGSEESPLGVYENNDSYSLSLSRSF